MGKPKFSRKKFETPSHPWEQDRIKEENELIKKYGLKNKKEVWKAETRLRKYRQQARGLLASITTEDPQSKKESEQLLSHLNRMSVLPANANLDDVLILDTENILSRRLQTIVYLKGLASTPKQSRQLINHGHIKVKDRKVTIPGYMVTRDEESEISYTGDSPLNDNMHPARPRGEFKSTPRKKEEPKKKEEKKSEVKPEEKKEKKETEKKSEKEEKTEEKPKEKEKEEKKPSKEQEKTEKKSEEKKEPSEKNKKSEGESEKKEEKPKEQTKKEEEKSKDQKEEKK